MGVNYAGLSVVAVKAMQEQQEEIEQQQTQIEALLQKNEELKAQLAESKAENTAILNAMQKEIDNIRAHLLREEPSLTKKD